MPRKFLVVVDDSPELDAALRYASRRARSTGGRVALLRVIPRGSDEHWSGVREEIEREQREEAEALLARLGEEAADRSGAQPLFLIEEGEAPEAIRKVVGEDPEADAKWFRRTDSGIVLITQDMVDARAKALG